MAHSSKTVLLALTGNAFVTVIKLVGFILSGSGAMLSEAVHSFADTGNQMLLYLGLKRGAREADDQFQYGYGGDRFVFGMLSASGIFFVGSGVTIYHGVAGLITPHPPRLGVATFVILAVSFVIEGAVLLVAIKGLVRDAKGTPFRRFLREGADPAAVAILLEDGAAVLGLVLAALGIFATYLTGDPVFDSIASLVVGLMLGVIAIELVVQNRALLLGKAVPGGVEDRFVEILLARTSVIGVNDVKTRQLTSERYTLKAELKFDTDYLATKIRVDKLPEDRTELVRILTAAVTDLVATEIAALERAIIAAIPQARHIDLEVAHSTSHADEVKVEVEEYLRSG